MLCLKINKTFQSGFDAPAGQLDVIDEGIINYNEEPEFVAYGMLRNDLKKITWTPLFLAKIRVIPKKTRQANIVN